MFHLHSKKKEPPPEPEGDGDSAASPERKRDVLQRYLYGDGPLTPLMPSTNGQQADHRRCAGVISSPRAG
jgi:hypothetical protein